jgi:hypothetical protein
MEAPRVDLDIVKGLNNLRIVKLVLKINMKSIFSYQELLHPLQIIHTNFFDSFSPTSESCCPGPELLIRKVGLPDREKTTAAPYS